MKGKVMRKPLGEEMEFFRQYNEVLFNQLEKKILDKEEDHQHLRISVEEYRLQFENISDVVFMVGTDFNILSISPSVEKLLGYKAEDFISRPASDLRHIFTSESFERAIANISKMLKGKRIPISTYTFVAKDGTLKHIEIHGSPLIRDGQVEGTISVARDISECKRMEEKLRESEEKYRELIKYAPAGLYEVDYETNLLINVNDAICEYTGYTRDELLTMNFFNLFTEESQKLILARIENLMVNETIPQTVEYCIRTKGGEELWVLLNARYIYKAGILKGATGVIYNITERKRVEDVLKESEKKYRVILENASDAILLTDEKGNLIEANRMAEEFFGYSKEELLQMNYTQLHPMIELDRTIAAFKSIVTHGCGFLQNGVILRKDSKVVPVDITATAIKYNARDVIQASFRDISEHKYTERTLDKLVRERTDELSEKNKQLVEEIKQRKRAETSLKRQAKEIQLHSGKLQELNATLKVLLKQRDEDRAELEQKVMSNTKHLLFPHLDQLKKCKFDPKSRMHLDILESNLHNITASFSHKLSSNHNNLTPTEIKVANLVKEGKTTKDIAEFLGSSPSSITIHRFHIRRKLGLIGKEINLQSYLTSLS